MDIIDNSPVAGAGYSDEQINENLGVAPVKSAVIGYNPEDGTYTAPNKDFKYQSVSFQMKPTDTNNPRTNRVNARYNDVMAEAYTDPRLSQYLHNYDPDYGGQPIGEPFRTGMSDFMAHEYGRVDYDNEAGPMLTEEQVKQNRDDKQWDVPAVFIQGIPRFAARTVLTMGSAAGGVVKSIADVFGGNKFVDEYVSPEAFAGYNEKFVDWMKEQAPIYDNKSNEEYAEKHPIYSMFCTANGWAETMDMLGFTTGAIASAYMMGKLGRPVMAGLATLQLGQAGTKMWFSGDTAEDSEKYVQLGLSAAALAGAGVTATAKVFGSSMLNMIPGGVKNAVGVLSGGILASAAEAEVEATNAKNDFIAQKSSIIDGDVSQRKLMLQQDYEAEALKRAQETYEEKYNEFLAEYRASGMDEEKAQIQASMQARVQASVAYEENMKDLGDQFAILEWDGVKAKNKIIEESTRAADITRMFNYLILSSSHCVQFGKLFTGGFKTNRTMGQIGMRAEAEEAAEAAYRNRLKAAATRAERKAVKAEKDKIKAQAIMAWARNNEGKVFNETGKLTSGDLFRIFVKNPMSEGMEEMIQGSVSNAGKGISEWYVDDYYNQIKSSGTYKKTEDEWIARLAGLKAAGRTWTTESAWGEFLAGALMGAVGSLWIRRTRRATAVDENGNTTGEVKNKWLSWLHWRPTFVGGIRGEYERAVKTRKDMQAFADRLNEAMTDEGVGRLRKILAAMAKSMQFREDMGIYADNNNRFAFQNEADKDILNTVELYQNTGQLALLRGMVESLDGMSDEELRAFRDMTTSTENNVEVGPYAEFKLYAPEQLTTDTLKQQNHDNAERMRAKIRENVWKYTTTIDTYVKERKELDFETNQAFTDEQLNCLTWYKTRIGMFDDRAANMYGKSKGFLSFVRNHIDDIIDAMRADHEKKVAAATAIMDQLAKKPEGTLSDQEKIYYQELALEVQALNDFNANADYIKEAFIERYDKADRMDDDLAAVRLLFAGNKKAKPMASSWYGRLRHAITGRLNSSHNDWQRKNKAVNDFFDVLSDMMGGDITELQTASVASQNINDQSARQTTAEWLTDMKRCQDAALQFKDRFQFYKDNPEEIAKSEAFAQARVEREAAATADAELNKEFSEVRTMEDVYNFVIKHLRAGTNPDDIERVIMEWADDSSLKRNLLQGELAFSFLRVQRFIIALRAALERVVVEVPGNVNKKKNIVKEFILAVAIECAKKYTGSQGIGDSTNVDTVLQHNLIQGIKDEIDKITSNSHHLFLFLHKHDLVWNTFNEAFLNNDKVTYHKIKNGKNEEYQTNQEALEIFRDESQKILTTANELIRDLNDEYLLNTQGVSLTEEEREESTLKVNAIAGEPAVTGVEFLNKLISIGVEEPNKDTGLTENHQKKVRNKYFEEYANAVRSGRYLSVPEYGGGLEAERKRARIVRDYLKGIYGNKLSEDPANLSEKDRLIQEVHRLALEYIHYYYDKIFEKTEEGVVEALEETDRITSEEAAEYKNDDEKKKEVYTRIREYYEEVVNKGSNYWGATKGINVISTAKDAIPRYTKEIDKLDGRSSGNQSSNQSSNQSGNQGSNQGNNQGGNQGSNQGNNQSSNQGGNQGNNQGSSNQGGQQGGNRRVNGDKKREEEELKKKLSDRRKHLKGIAEQNGRQIPDSVRPNSPEFGLWAARILRDVALGELENRPTNPEDMTKEQLLDSIILEQAGKDIRKYHNTHIPTTADEAIERAIDLRIISSSQRSGDVHAYEKVIEMLNKLAKKLSGNRNKNSFSKKDQIDRVRVELYKRVVAITQGNSQGEDNKVEEEQQSKQQPAGETQQAQSGENAGQQPKAQPEPQVIIYQTRKKKTETFPNEVMAQMPALFRDVIKSIAKEWNQTINDIRRDIVWDGVWREIDKAIVDRLYKATTEEEKTKYRCLLQEFRQKPGDYRAIIIQMAEEEKAQQSQDEEQGKQTKPEGQQAQAGATMSQGQPETQPQAGATMPQGQPETQAQAGATVPQGQPETQAQAGAAVPQGQPETQPQAGAAVSQGQPETQAQAGATMPQGQPEEEELSEEAKKLRGEMKAELIEAGVISQADTTSDDPRAQRRVAKWLTMQAGKIIGGTYEEEERKAIAREINDYYTNKLKQYQKEVLDRTEEDLIDSYESNTLSSLSGDDRKTICEELIKFIDGTDRDNIGSVNKTDDNKEAIGNIREKLQEELAEINGESYLKKDGNEFISPDEEGDGEFIDPSNKTEVDQNSKVDAENETLPTEEEKGGESDVWRSSVSYFDAGKRKEKIFEYLGNNRYFAKFFSLLTRLNIFSCIDDVAETSPDFIKTGDKVYFVVDKIMPGKDRSETFGLTANEMAYNGRPYVWICVKNSQGRFQAVGAMNTAENKLRQYGQLDLYNNIVAAAKKAQGVYVHNETSRVTKVYEGFIHKTNERNSVAAIARDGKPQLAEWQRKVVGEGEEKKVEWILLERDKDGNWPSAASGIDTTYRKGELESLPHDYHSGMVCIKIKNNRDGKYHLVACRVARFNASGRNRYANTKTWKEAEKAVNDIVKANDAEKFEKAFDALNAVLSLKAYGIHINRRVKNGKGYLTIEKVLTDKNGVVITERKKDKNGEWIDVKKRETIFTGLIGSRDLLGRFKGSLESQDIPFRIDDEMLQEGFVTAPVEKGADTYKGGNIEFSAKLEKISTTQAAEQTKTPEQPKPQPKPEPKPEPTFMRPDYVEKELFEGAVTLKADRSSDKVFINGKEVKNKVIAKKLSEFVAGDPVRYAVINSDESLAFVEEEDGNNVKISFIKLKGTPSIDVVTCPNNKDNANLNQMAALIERIDEDVKESGLAVKSGEGNFLQRLVDTLNDNKTISKLKKAHPDVFNFHKFATQDNTQEASVLLRGKLAYALIDAKLILSGDVNIDSNRKLTSDDFAVVIIFIEKLEPNEGIKKCIEDLHVAVREQFKLEVNKYLDKEIDFKSLVDIYKEIYQQSEKKKEEDGIEAQKEVERKKQAAEKAKQAAKKAKQAAEEAALKRKEAALKRKEEEAKRKEEEAKRKEEEAKRKAEEEAKRKAAAEQEGQSEELQYFAEQERLEEQALKEEQEGQAEELLYLAEQKRLADEAEKQVLRDAEEQARIAEEDAKFAAQAAVEKERQAAEQLRLAEQNLIEKEMKNTQYDESLSREYESWQWKRRQEREKRHDETELEGEEEEQQRKRDEVLEQDMKEVKGEIFTAATKLIGIKNEDFKSQDTRVRRNALRAVWREANALVERVQMGEDEETSFGGEHYWVSIASESEILNAVISSLQDPLFELSRELVEDDLEGILESLRDTSDDWNFVNNAAQMKSKLLSSINNELRKSGISEESKAKLEALRKRVEENWDEVKDDIDAFVDKKILTPNSLESRQLLKELQEYGDGESPEQRLSEIRAQARIKLRARGVDVDQIAQGQQATPATNNASPEVTQAQMISVLNEIFERCLKQQDKTAAEYMENGLSVDFFVPEIEDAVDGRLQEQMSNEERVKYERFKQSLNDEDAVTMYMENISQTIANTNGVTDSVSSVEDDISEEQNDDSDGDLAYSVVKESERSQPRVDFSKEIEALRTIDPSMTREDAIRIIDGLIETGRKGVYAQGLFRDGHFIISRQAVRGTVFHEAFHKIFRTALTEAKRRELLMDTKRAAGNEELADYEAEELLCDWFRDYAVDRVYGKSWTQRIKDFFRALFHLRSIGYERLRDVTLDCFNATLGGRYGTTFSYEDVKTSRINECFRRGMTPKQVSMAENRRSAYESRTAEEKAMLDSMGVTPEAFNMLSPKSREEMVRCM